MDWKTLPGGHCVHADLVSFEGTNITEQKVMISRAAHYLTDKMLCWWMKGKRAFKNQPPFNLQTHIQRCPLSQRINEARFIPCEKTGNGKWASRLLKLGWKTFPTIEINTKKQTSARHEEKNPTWGKNTQHGQEAKRDGLFPERKWWQRNKNKGRGREMINRMKIKVTAERKADEEKKSRREGDETPPSR